MSAEEGKLGEGNLGRIGFFGCSGRLVVVSRPKKPGKPPVNFNIDCPACGRRHIARPMWRERLPTDREPEVSLP